MPLEHHACQNCGFWQEYFAAPPDCPVCSDVRNALPADGWRFTSAAEMRAQEEHGEITGEWMEIDNGIWMFSAVPQLGIGSSGYLIERSTGNIAFEAAGWYTQNALQKIRELGGIRFLSASHPHGFGALWQLQREFAPQTTAFQREAIRFTKAFDVNLAFDNELNVDEASTLFYVGGHYEGQSILYYAPKKILFAGDALKFEEKSGKTIGVSCHKAFHKQIPLSKSEIEKYQAVISGLDFKQVCTPFEHTADATTKDATHLFETLLKSEKTFAVPIPIERNL